MKWIRLIPALLVFFVVLLPMVFVFCLFWKNSFTLLRRRAVAVMILIQSMCRLQSRAAIWEDIETGKWWHGYHQLEKSLSEKYTDV